MEKKLNDIFSNVNFWLQYSELKNGILLSIHGAVIIGLITFLKDAHTCIKHPLMYCLIPILILSLCISLFSFLPFKWLFYKERFNLNEKDMNKLNLIYFGDIRKLSDFNFLRLLYKSSEVKIPNYLKKYERDMAHQIVTNSKIAYRKLMIFTFTLILDLISVLVTTIYFIILLIR